MFNFHKNHRSLLYTSILVYLGLSTLIAVIPAYQLQDTQPLPSMPSMTEQEMSGLNVFISENCAACHTQQVRNIEMDQVWGERPSIPSDYYYSKQRLSFWQQSPSLLGSERTGPDLTNIGKRQSGQEWHLIHLFNPRAVVKQSIMPSYKWLFEEKNEKDISKSDVLVAVPAQFLQNPKNKVVATQKALDLVAYLRSLKQAALPGEPEIKFIPSTRKPDSKATTGAAASNLPDGATLYTNTCAPCHQADGKGLPGAFPSLAGSSIVNDANPESLIKIVMQGYDARAEFGVMPPFAGQLKDEEIAAITTHERSSWGNKAPTVTVDDVKKVREFLKTSK